MRREVVEAQFTVGLHGLGLLRAWPFLDPEIAERELDALRAEAVDKRRGNLDIFEVSDGYAAWSASYDLRVNPLLVAEQPAVSALLDEIPPGQALDVGCGTGRLTRLLLDCGHVVHGVDISEEMLDLARRTAPGATYTVSPLEELPFADDSWDLVVCGLALTHIAALDPVIAEFGRVLRRGGRLVISDVHPVAVATGAHAFFGKPDGSRCVIRNELHWHGDYLGAFSNAGLRVTSCLEPRFSEQVLEAFLGNGRDPALIHLVGLPSVLVWECRSEKSGPSP